MVPPADLAIAVDTTVASMFGLLANGLILALTLPDKQLRSKDYICFILNRTVIDLTYSLAMGILQPWSILTAPADDRSTLCTITGFLENAIGCATIFAEPALACNRFLATNYNNLHKKICTMRNVIVACVGVWMMGIVTTIPHLFTQSLGRVTGAFCCIHFDENSLLVTIISTYMFILIGQSLVAFFNYKIYTHIRAHQNKNLDRKQRSRLQQDKDMLYFIAAGTLAPLLVQLPAVTGSWLYMFRPDLSSDWVMVGVLSIFSLTTVVNPIVTLLMVRPIRKRLVTTMNLLRGKTTTVVSIVPLSQTDTQMPIRNGNAKQVSFGLAKVG